MEGALLGQFLPVDSVIHRLDPRSKFISALFITLAVLIPGWLGMTLAAPVVCAGVVLSGITPLFLWKQVKSFWFILALTVLFQVFSTAGDALYRVGPVYITSRGLWAGLELLVRLVLVIMAGTVLMATTTALNLAAGIERLLKPVSRLGIPVNEIVLAVTIAIGFVPVILEEARIILSSQFSRGAGFYGRGPAEKARSVFNLMIPLLAGTLRRSEDLATAMEARCYRGGTGRTSVNVLALSYRDAICILICGLPLILAAAIQVALLK
ncbi:MAG: energy-coupling factor transporter transmembrane component T family protein [Bacillota bacterium]